MVNARPLGIDTGMPEQFPPKSVRLRIYWLKISYIIIMQEECYNMKNWNFTGRAFEVYLIWFVALFVLLVHCFNSENY